MASNNIITFSLLIFFPSQFDIFFVKFVIILKRNGTFKLWKLNESEARKIRVFFLGLFLFEGCKYIVQFTMLQNVSYIQNRKLLIYLLVIIIIESNMQKRFSFASKMKNEPHRVWLLNVILFGVFDKRKTHKRNIVKELFQELVREWSNAIVHVIATRHGSRC